MNTEKPNIKLDADKSTVAQKTIQGGQFALANIAHALKSDSGLDFELATNVLSLLEHYTAELGQLLGVQTNSENDIKERSEKLRKANERVRELETQLGQAQTTEMIGLGLRTLEKQIREWWKLEGFGHVSDITFGGYGCKIDLSCHLFGRFMLINSPTPVSDKERKRLWHQALKDQGFELAEEEREVSVLDSEASRAALCTLIQQRLPSSSISKTTNSGLKGGGFTMRSVEIYVRNMGEILSLPVPPSAEESHGALLC